MSGARASFKAVTLPQSALIALACTGIAAVEHFVLGWSEGAVLWTAGLVASAMTLVGGIWNARRE